MPERDLPPRLAGLMYLGVMLAFVGMVVTPFMARPQIRYRVNSGPAYATAAAWPTAATTGVPSGVVLTDYSSPCTITVANTVLDSKNILCDLTIQAANVTVSRSRMWSIATDEASTTYSYNLSDSDVVVGDHAGTGVGAVHFTATRVHVTGGNRSINCWIDCKVVDSLVENQFTDPTGVYHESGIRMGDTNVIQHNSILCNAVDVPPDGGCSADMSGYGDFAAVQNVLVISNLFRATTGGYCSYGGSTAGKPFSSGANNIQFIDNVYERGPTGHCGSFGYSSDFDPGQPGNVWSNNRYDDGTPVGPA